MTEIYSNPNHSFDRMLSATANSIRTELEEAERKLSFSRSMRELAGDPRWEMVSKLLRKEGSSLWQHFMRTDIDMADVARTQGRIEMLQSILGAVTVTDDDILDLERMIPVLRERLRVAMNQ
jgi:hypothetical protein